MLFLGLLYYIGRYSEGDYFPEKMRKDLLLSSDL